MENLDKDLKFDKPMAAAAYTLKVSFEHSCFVRADANELPTRYGSSNWSHRLFLTASTMRRSGSTLPVSFVFLKVSSADLMPVTVGAGDTEKSNVEAIKALFQPVPRIHVLVLNAVMKHFEDLVKGTKTPNEGDIIYLTKLGLSLGRGMLI